MKAAYAIFVREKMRLASFVEGQVRAAFAQTHPCEILLSDQGSTDGTRELLERLAAEYAAADASKYPKHHQVRVLNCPDTAMRGMAGLNAHLAWLHNQTEAEYFIHAAADDWAAPRRAEVLVDAFERTGADMAGAAMFFQKPGEERPHSRSAYARTGWVSVDDCVTHKMGGSAAAGWRRSLWERIAPIPGICSPDVWMPPLACVLGGFWYVNEPLYTYFHHADGGNTGLEGALLAAKDEAAKRVIDEHRFFQSAASWEWALRRMLSLRVGTKDDHDRLRQAAYAYFEVWLSTRMEMTVKREAPEPFRI